MMNRCLHVQFVLHPRAGLIAVGVVSFALWGCHRPSNGVALVAVSGVATMDAKPIEGALVVFCPESPAAPAASGTTDHEGRFSLTTYVADDGAAPGAYRVTVTKDAMLGGMTRKEAEAYVGQFHRPPPPPKVTHLLPSQYADAAKTPLHVEVKPNMPEIDFVLKQ